MVQSKEELRRCAAAWTDQAKNDVRNKIIEFMDVTHLNEAQVADALDISVNEVRSLLRTNNEINLSLFAKLLIATDNVLEIKPLSASPLATAPHGAVPRSAARRNATRQQPQTPQRDAHGRFVSSRGAAPRNEGFPMPPMGAIPTDRNGRPLPPPPGFPMPSHGMDMPPRFGGMPGVRRQQQVPHVEEEAPTVGGLQPLDELASHTRAELVQMIRDNFWDGEIDLEEASKSDIITFLASKRNTRAEEVVPQPTAEVEQPTEERDASLEEFSNMLQNALAQNPHLRDVIKQYTD